MESNDLNHMVNEMIRGIFADAVGASMKDPAMAAFFMRAAVAQKKAAAVRQRNEERGLHVPPVMTLSVTNRCNLRCAGCYSRLVPRERKPELSEEGLRNVLKQASELGISIVLVVGGEPLLRPEIFDITRDFPDMVFTLFTNGTLIDDAAIQKFKEQKHVIPILSMEGNEGVTDLRRGAGIYGRLMKDMAKLNENGLFFGTSLTVTKTNYDTVTGEDFIRRMREHGCKAFIFVEYNPVQEGTEGLVVTDEQREEILEKMATYRKAQPGVYIGFPGDEKAFGGCLSSGRGFIHVSASGDIEPCPFAPYSDCSILDTPLKEALNSRLFRALQENRDKLMESGGGCALWRKPEWVKSLMAVDEKPVFKS
ncbi:radical SAM protein [Methanocella conradii]|uniref:radical SAM protein n=1 Tax=Methanocella conradii TaxID=1175444 RepID=UPI00157D4348|nr:radical SAM protein [Methanocella conradii]